jgi:hypothetical protein
MDISKNKKAQLNYITAYCFFLVCGGDMERYWLLLLYGMALAGKGAVGLY